MSGRLPFPPVPPAPRDPASDSGTWGTPERPCPSETLLASHVDGEIDRARRAAVESHLDSCGACSAAARRLEGLSGLLRDWESKRSPEPPPRLIDAVLREVSSDAALRRRRGLRVFARGFAAAAAVLAVAAGGALLGASDARTARPAAEPPSVSSAGALAAARATVAALPARSQGIGAVDVPDAAPLHVRAEGFDEIANAVAALPNPLRLRSAPWTALSDATGRAAFAGAAAALDARRAFGEDPCIYGGQPYAPWAISEVRRAERETAWLKWREGRLADRTTLDPLDTGFALTTAVPLPARAAIPSFLVEAPTAEGVATRRQGGIVVRALVEGAPSGGVPAGGVTAPAVVAADTVSDLASAVRAGRVQLSEDAKPRPDVVLLIVAKGDVPVFVPAGELLSGGIVDRVVARGVWLPPSRGDDLYQVRVSCRAVSREARRTAEPPLATGLLAGPGLRGLLAIGPDADTVLALVDSQLQGAALSAADGKPVSLLRLYEDAAEAQSRAKEMLAAFPTSARGYVATDPSGRWQGLEWTSLPPASAPAFLRRLLSGYVLEARSRSSVDGVRTGAHVESVLAGLWDRPVRLLRVGDPSSGVRAVFGDDPVTGVTFDAVAADGDALPLVSGLYPEIR